MATLHQPAKWNSDDKLIYANNFNIWSKTNKRKQSNECSPYFACNQTCMLQRRSFRSDILSFNPNAFPSCCVIHCCLLSRWLLISTLVLHPYLPDLSLMLRRRTVKWGNEGDGHLFLTPKFCQLSRWREWLMLWKNNNTTTMIKYYCIHLSSHHPSLCVSLVVNLHSPTIAKMNLHYNERRLLKMFVISVKKKEKWLLVAPLVCLYLKCVCFYFEY